MQIGANKSIDWCDLTVVYDAQVHFTFAVEERGVGGANATSPGVLRVSVVHPVVQQKLLGNEQLVGTCVRKCLQGKRLL